MEGKVLKKGKTLLPVIIILLIIVAMGVTAGKSLRNDNIANAKIAKAKEAIYNFTGNPKLDLRYNGTLWKMDGNVLEFYSGKTCYRVTEAGQVLDETHTGQSWEGNLSINEAEAFAKAKAFAARKYANFNSRDMRLVDIKSNMQTKYYWREAINGISTPNFVSVLVNPYSGEVADYSCRDIEIPTTEPKLSKDDAIRIFKEDSPEAANIQADLDVWLYDAKPILRWKVRATVPGLWKNPDGNEQEPSQVEVEINAETGEVIGGSST